MTTERNLTKEYGKFEFKRINDKISLIEALVIKITSENLKENLEGIFDDFSITKIKGFFVNHDNYLIISGEDWIHLSLDRNVYKEGTNDEYKNYSDLYAFGDSQLIDKLAGNLKEKYKFKK